MPLRLTSLSFTRRLSLGSITERALRWLKPARCLPVNRRVDFELQSLEARDLPGESLMALLWTHAGAAAFNLGGGVAKLRCLGGA